MIKFIVAALWICAATVGAVFYSFQATGARNEEVATKPLLGGLDYVNTGTLSIPLMRNSKIEGYFIAKLVYTVEPAQMAKLSVPANALFTDEIYSYLYSNPQIDFTRQDTIDVEALRTKLREAVNKRVGVDLVSEVLIDQLDFLSKDEIRDNALRRRSGPSTASEMTKAFATPASGH
ncbi:MULTISPECIES: hypothetical protein [unclassified Mesorhizobium]|uniref:hypothetical protein n=1 Tax=unclassified Mesorhizobium TaxID=325217 RepID=UPI0007016747|nr:MULTISPECIES: hypothetical protein [unclassified Mesorhizobium]KQZ14427.1 hypothetical protein ASD27_10355 [Mesorhizobium sp. Root1471]KQZ36937.1 hypothetical protein ASD44_10345 [Mesorhizobium sp. Root554]MDR7034672.1 hypothetical protein [Mesorhizobium sp. BE184]